MGEPSRAAQCTLILASSSPRRRMLLAQAGYRFRVCAPHVQERTEPGEKPEDAAQRLALEKGRAVAANCQADSCVLAADTIVVLGGEMLGKPRDEPDAVRMLLALSGRTHQVLTGYALLAGGGRELHLGVASSQVRMRTIAEQEAREYAATGESLDKAGGYALQGEAGRFVAAVDGARDNVIGLPLGELAPLLAAHGVTPE
jgi:septum formation protein